MWLEHVVDVAVTIALGRPEGSVVKAPGSDNRLDMDTHSVTTRHGPVDSSATRRASLNCHYIDVRNVTVRLITVHGGLSKCVGCRLPAIQLAGLRLSSDV